MPDQIKGMTTRNAPAAKAPAKPAKADDKAAEDKAAEEPEAEVDEGGLTAEERKAARDAYLRMWPLAAAEETR